MAEVFIAVSALLIGFAIGGLCELRHSREANEIASRAINGWGVALDHWKEADARTDRALSLAEEVLASSDTDVAIGAVVAKAARTTEPKAAY